jgi:RND family efflux transporter MFP subunit
MAATDTTDESRRRPSRLLLTLLVIAAIVVVTSGLIWVIRNTAPEAEQSAATRRSAALVETLRVERGTFAPELVVLGTVEASRDITLRSRVTGEVVEISERFVPGSVVALGDRLLTLDPADFEIALALRQSDLREARAALAIEESRRSVARQEFAVLGESIEPSNQSLVLREPQIESARARVDAAQAAVDQARLDLERTRLGAPFAGKVIRRDVNLGSQVSPGEPLARIVGTEEYWVTTMVPQRSLRWIAFPERGEAGARVEVRNRSVWTTDEVREGEVMRLVGVVDDQTRLARILVSVRDPLALETEAPPLLLGTFVEARIAGRPLPDVVRLPRDYLRQGNTAWVMAEGALAIRELEIVFADANFAYVGAGLEDGDEIVTTPLATVAEGIPLRKQNPDTVARSAETEGGES